MTVNRKLLKATNTSTLKQQDQDASQYEYKAGDRNFLKIEPGSNKFRIYPAHPGNDSFIKMFGVHWLTLETEVTDSKDKSKKTVELKRRPIFNARIHAGSEKDIVEEYIKAVQIKLKADYPQDEAKRSDLWKRVTDFKEGITLKLQWSCYAHKIGKDGTKQFGILNVSSPLKDKINATAAFEDDSNSPITIDPFTDPDEGKAVIVTYNKGSEDKTKTYTAAIEFRGNYALTEEEVDHFLAQDSLEKLYGKECYTKKDFEKEYAGLQLFDEKNKFGIFENEDWMNFCEEQSNLYPEVEEEKPSESQNGRIKASTVKYDPKAKEKNTNFIEKVKEQTKIREQGDTSETPGEDNPPIDLMTREELVAFNKKEKLGITIFPKMSDEMIAEQIKMALEAREDEEKGPDELEAALSQEKSEDEIKKESKVNKFKSGLKK